MDLRQLRYFTRIVELGSISAAAEALHTAQPSLSKHVSKLEAEFDTQLLVRGVSGVKPTVTGQILYRHAKGMLRQAEEAKAAVKHGRDVPSGTVIVGLPTSTSRVLAMPLLERVRAEMPEVTLALVEGATYDLAQAVVSHRIDLAITTDVHDHPNILVKFLLNEELFLVSRADDPCLSSHISVEQLADLPLVLPQFPNSVRVRISRLMLESGREIQLVAESSATEILLASVQRGIGHTVLPWSALATASGVIDSLRTRSISEHGLHRPVMLCTSSASSGGLALSMVQHAIQELTRELVIDERWKGVQLIDTPSSQ